MKRINSIIKTGAAFIGIWMAAGVYKVNAQTNTNNYVITNTPRLAGIINDSTLAANASDKTKVQIAIQYVDGLGRPLQTIQKQASPLGYDMIQPQAYDQYGREITSYLPYTPQSGTSGSYRPNAVSSDQGSFYSSPPSGSGVSSISYPYAQTTFDNSPLNRTVEQGAPGSDWQLGNHTVKTVYTLNNATAWTTDSVNSRQVAFYYTTINSDNSQNLVANSYYAANTLTVTISKDENWISGRAGTVEEYKDIDGRIILKREYNYTGGALQQLSTYYVYDDSGHLAFVLTPLSGADGAATISQTTLDNLCYQYQYDERNRQVQKKLPGKGWEYEVYNTMDQPVATQDANQRSNNQWVFTKYDAQQRVIMTGIWNNGNTAISRASLQNTLTGITSNLYEATQTTGNGYTNVAWPTNSVTATLMLNYYDSYANAIGSPYGAPSGANLATRGELVAAKINVLNTTDMLWGVHYFDNWGRNMTSYAEHYLGGTLNSTNYDAVTITYDFTNAPTTTTRKHWTSSSTSYPLVTIANRFIYDQIGRKLKNWEQVTSLNNAPTTRTLISQTDYNEVGQLITKHLHSTDSVSFLQNVAYTYNQRGWLLTSSAPLFAMQLYYNTGTSKQYNGNIAYQYWGTPGNLNNNYSYTYDNLSRLIIGTASTGNSETGITYDLMGNIQSLTRSGVSPATLAYSYTGNQLQTVTNSGSAFRSYGYDGNGNATSDGQGNTINYNILNLPQTIPGKSLTYTYDVTGNKLRKYNGVTYTDYINGIQYDNGTITFVQTEEGRVLNLTGTPNYEYSLSDNLGNSRVNFDSSHGGSTATQTDNYYPFGLAVQPTTTSPPNNYLYNKKELQPELTQYDYGARFYDPVIARWNTIDPLAELNRRFSPYAYVKNNPLRLIDPDGMMDIDINKVGEPDATDEEEQLLSDNSFVKTSDKRARMQHDISAAPTGKDTKYDYDQGVQTNSTVSAPSGGNTENAGTAAGITGPATGIDLEVGHANNTEPDANTEENDYSTQHQRQRPSTFEAGLKNVIDHSKVGDEITSKDLIDKYGIPKSAANLINSITKKSNNSVAVDWVSAWNPLMAAAKVGSDAVFKDGTLNIQQLKNGTIRLSGDAIGIKYNGKTYHNLILNGNNVTIPGVSGWYWKIGIGK